MPFTGIIVTVQCFRAAVFPIVWLVVVIPKTYGLPLSFPLPFYRERNGNLVQEHPSFLVYLSIAFLQLALSEMLKSSGTSSASNSSSSALVDPILALEQSDCISVPWKIYFAKVWPSGPLSLPAQ